MRLSRLKWLSFLGLLLFVAALDLLHSRLHDQLVTPSGRLLMDAFVLSGGIFLFGMLFAFLKTQEQRLQRQNIELLALHHAALDLGGELGLDALLQKIVDAARPLIGARYGALSVMDREGQIDAFVVSGLGEAERARIGHPPVGRGLLGLVLEQGKSLRVAQIAGHPDSAGFPAHHPQMSSLLAVPIVCRSPFRGNLYLSDKLDDLEFTEGDEATLTRFATQAANAIDGAHLHERLRALAIEEERLRLAREMHDGLAQILASVNARSQAVREHMRSGRSEEAIALLDRLAADARNVHAEVREGILALRIAAADSGSIAETLGNFLDDWQDQTGIRVEAQLDSSLRFPPEREVQLIRVAQEALANVRKHSGAQRVRFALTDGGREVLLVIADDGRGFDPERPSSPDGRPHFGLLTMRERAQAVDGRLEIDSSPGGGTTVRLTLPAGRSSQRTAWRSA